MLNCMASGGAEVALFLLYKFTLGLFALLWYNYNVLLIKWVFKVRPSTSSLPTELREYEEMETWTLSSIFLLNLIMSRYKMELLAQNNFEEFSITLKEITDLIEVDHSKSMKKVEKLAMESEFGQLAKVAICIKIGNGAEREIQTYSLNKKQAIAVGARLNNSLLMKVINRLEELETQSKTQLPQTFSEALLLASKQAEVIEKQTLTIAQKSETIKNVVHSHNTYTASQVAKDMPNPISATLLNKMLVEADVIFKQNGTYQLYSRYNGYNLTEIKETKPDQNGKTYASMRWTALGKSWIYKNWTGIKQRVSTQTLSEWEFAITSKLPKVPMPKKQDRNF